MHLDKFLSIISRCYGEGKMRLIIYLKFETWRLVYHV